MIETDCGKNNGSINKVDTNKQTNNDDGYLTIQSGLFDAGVAAMNIALTKALGELTKDPSNPVLLAKYQSLLSEYTLYRNLQSNVIKTLKDVDNNIISNFR
ncbi:MAG TPA: type III secretion system needle filament subunit SctF [Arsenophonus sp.]